MLFASLTVAVGEAWINDPISSRQLIVVWCIKCIEDVSQTSKSGELGSKAASGHRKSSL